jgi:hypothetical protein
MSGSWLTIKSLYVGVRNIRNIYICCYFVLEEEYCSNEERLVPLYAFPSENSRLGIKNEYNVMLQ